MARQPDFHEHNQDAASARWSPTVALAGFIAFCLLVAAVDGVFTQGGVRDWYPSLTRPPGTPPNWVFPVVWTTLYIMIGVAGWLLWRRRAWSTLRLWGWQILVNALWNPIFFGLHQIGIALIVIMTLLALIFRCIQRFKAIDALAAWLFVPYAVWVCYATYLNVGFWWLN
ncbi:TspO/MBR family protein [Granulibacter bethesdensis]|uniref:TspO/MBR family protein n=1 Tax=Granulibacter bethesdensis TaxID=364410 RepID=UPI0003F1E7E2|nr:TspO/MBR family protein [Granulibacter bethesdensis]AHJ68520.1 CrtK protein [Granulibacter bethesdensis]